MPFTLSHAVLAPPLAKLSKNTLPIAALAIGCMTPDLYRLFTAESYTINHEWAGLFIPNLPIGLFFCLLWYLLYRPVLYRCFHIEDSLHLISFDHYCRFIIMVILAVLIGTSTHILWDGLTHGDERAFIFEQQLRQPIEFLHHSYPLHRILQIGFSVMTLPILTWMCVKYLKEHRIKAAKQSYALFNALIILIPFIIGLGCFINFIPSELMRADLYGYIGSSFNMFCRGYLVSLSLLCIMFLLAQIFFKSARL